MGQNLLLATMAALPATQSGARGARGQIRGGGGTRASATGTGGGRTRRRRKRRGAAAEEEAEGAERWRLALRSGRGVPARDGSEVGTAMGVVIDVTIDQLRPEVCRCICIYTCI